MQRRSEALQVGSKGWMVRHDQSSGSNDQLGCKVSFLQCIRDSLGCGLGSRPTWLKPVPLFPGPGTSRYFRP